MMKLLDKTSWKILVWPLSQLYAMVIQIRNFFYKKQWLTSKQMSAKVISVGNITVGGTGKTPLVESLASFLHEKGFSVAVLSRGYRRKKNKNEITVISDSNGLRENAIHAGDEPALLAEHLPEVRIIVSRDRVKAGMMAIEELGCDRLILDDGFQHRKMKRDVDIVVIDATNPWGNGGVLPAGPLREPIQNLKRADAVVLSRTDETDNLENLLIQIDTLCKAPIWFAKHKPEHWINFNQGTIRPICFLEKKCVAAFCGIGNPDSFKRTLMSMDVEIIDFFQYRDHHWYAVHELQKMSDLAQSKGAVALVTTEKDRTRIPESFANNIPVYILKIKMEIQGKGKALHTLLQPVTAFREGIKNER
jgi:tetraacyldisaccharide 4'-kinase